MLIDDSLRRAEQAERLAKQFEREHDAQNWKRGSAFVRISASSSERLRGIEA
jgi:hypothetical protein